MSTNSSLQWIVRGLRTHVGDRIFSRLSTHRAAQQRGFTLIETMVAISVLVVAVSAPLTLASQSLFAALYAKDQTTAFYLAQEAVELVRNKRDNNMLRILSGQEVGWLDGIPLDSNFHVDIPNDTIEECGSDCLSTKLRNDGIFYNYESGNTSRFGRSVRVTENQDLPDEAVISVVVEWQTGAFRERSITLEERIYNWVPRSGDVREPVGDGGGAPIPQCADGIDNDGDLLIDMLDPGCANPDDPEELDAALPVGGGTVICTELYNQGLLTQDIYEADAAFGATLSPLTMRGYHLWAAPVVSLMQRSQTATRVVAFIAEPWTEEMAYQMGVRSERNVIGAAMMFVGIPFSWAIGAVDAGLTTLATVVFSTVESVRNFSN